MSGAAQGLVALVGTTRVDEQDLLARLKSRLPAYMVPSAVVAVDPMPLSSSGKVDRSALLDLLRQSERWSIGLEYGHATDRIRRGVSAASIRARRGRSGP